MDTLDLIKFHFSRFLPLKWKIRKFLFEIGFQPYATRVQDGSFVDLGHLGNSDFNVTVQILSPLKSREEEIRFYKFDDNWNLDSRKKIRVTSMEDFMIEFDDFCKKI